jgi:predicted Holliday junction resolvase-like endonuclease
VAALVVLLLAATVVIVVLAVKLRRRHQQPEPVALPPSTQMAIESATQEVRKQLTTAQQRADDLARQLIVSAEQHRQEMAEYKHSLEVDWERHKREDRAQSNARSRSAIVAKVAEHLAPALPDFKYNMKDARHVGELYDFMIFDGLEEGYVRDVIFLEVKTGKSYQARQLNPREKLLRDAIENKRVRFEVYIPQLEQ